MQKIGFQTTKTNETPAKNWNMPFDVVVSRYQVGAYSIYYVFDKDDYQDSSSQPVSRVIVSVWYDEVRHLHKQSLADAVVWVVLTVSVAAEPGQSSAMRT